MRTLVNNEDTRGRTGGKCFYCAGMVGHPHDEECIIPKKKVKVRAIIEYEVDMPETFDDRMILFYLNEGTRCNDHIIEELEDLTKEDENGYSPCLCWVSKYELVEDSETTKKDTDDS